MYKIDDDLGWGRILLVICTESFREFAAELFFSTSLPSPSDSNALPSPGNELLMKNPNTYRHFLSCSLELPSLTRIQGSSRVAESEEGGLNTSIGFWGLHRIESNASLVNWFISLFPIRHCCPSRVHSFLHDDRLLLILGSPTRWRGAWKKKKNILSFYYTLIHNSLTL